MHSLLVLGIAACERSWRAGESTVLRRPGHRFCTLGMVQIRAFSLYSSSLALTPVAAATPPLPWRQERGLGVRASGANGKVPLNHALVVHPPSGYTTMTMYIFASSRRPT